MSSPPPSPPPTGSPGDPQNPYESPQQPGYQEPAYAATSDERLWAMLCHLSALCGAVVPLANIAAPLVIWLVQKDRMPLVDDQGKEALNFQISITIYAFVSGILFIVLVGIPLLIAVLIFNLVMVIVAAVKANQGEAYRYPLCIRLIS